MGEGLGGGLRRKRRAILDIVPQHRRKDPIESEALARVQTDAERKMWRLLRPFRDDGIPFRRQAPIGLYIADFAWLSGRLLIRLQAHCHAGLGTIAARTPSCFGAIP